MRTIFDQPDADAVTAQYGRVIEAIEQKFPAAAEHLDDSGRELPAEQRHGAGTTAREMASVLGAAALSAASRSTPYRSIGLT